MLVTFRGYRINVYCMIKSKMMLMVTPLDQNLDPIKMHYLNLYTVTPVCIFSILLPRHFLGSDKENLFNNQDIF